MAFRSSALACSLALFLTSGCSAPVKSEDVPRTPPPYQGPLVLEGDGRGFSVTEYRDRSRLKVERRFERCTYHRLYDTGAQQSHEWASCDPAPVATKPFHRELPNPHNAHLGRSAQPTGSCALAGQVGEVWRSIRPATFKGANGEHDEACITADGVVLRETLLSPDMSNPIVHWTATRVVREAPPEHAFDLPMEDQLSTLPRPAEVVAFVRENWDGLGLRFSRLVSRDGDFPTLLSVDNVSCEYLLNAHQCSYFVTAGFAPDDVVTQRLQSDFERTARGGLNEIILVRESPRR